MTATPKTQRDITEGKKMEKGQSIKMPVARECLLGMMEILYPWDLNTMISQTIPV